MIPVLLLAKAFARQNRWLLLAFVGWPFLLAVVIWFPHQAPSRDDISEIAQMEIRYGVVVVAFLASSAIYNEKRSRRIIGVLSKAVSREQYLGGLLLGSAYFAMAYYAAIGTATLWLAGVSSQVVSGVLAVFVNGTLASLWAASVALLLSTFLHPFFAAALAAGLAFAPFALRDANAFVAPVGALLAGSDPLATSMSPAAIAAAAIESALLLVLAAQIFVRRDVAVNIE
jgi:ABC-type transport system involved in multi-copper enzyme maturation permease subunit